MYRQNRLQGGASEFINTVGQAYVSDAVELIDDPHAYVILRADWASYQFGARRYNRFNLRPAVRLSYRTEFGRFALLYKRGVLRPSADEQNPEIDYISEFEQTVGNTSLGAELSDQLVFAYGRPVGSAYLSFNASASETRDMIVGVLANSYNLSTYENAARCRAGRLSASYRQPFFDYRFNVSGTLFAGWEEYIVLPRFVPKSQNQGNSGFSFGGYLDVSYDTESNWEFSLYGSYESRDVSFASTLYDTPIYGGEVAKGFLDASLRIALSVGGSYPNRRHTIYHLKGVQQVAFAWPAGMTTQFSLTWRFGHKFRMREAGEALENEDIRMKL